MNISRREAIAGTAALLGGFAMGKPTRGAMGATGANQTSAAGWVNPYVTDGLIAMWDGEWNAGWGVHDAAATVWKDLVDGSETILPASATVAEKAVEFSNNATISWPISSALSNALTTTDITIETTVRILPYTSVAYRNLIAASDMGSVFSIYSSRSTNNTTKYIFFNYYGRNSSILSDVLDEQGQFEGTISLACDSKTMTGFRFKNGVLGNRATYSTIPTTAPTSLTTSLMPSAIVRNIRIYSRALTAEEVAHNYAVDKQRFTLP